MVSKVAVIALVAIVACPILLGYAMNLSETTVTDYKIGNDSVNVTPLLQNDVIYSSVYADPYLLNSNMAYVSNVESINESVDPIIPIYEKLTSANTSLPLFKNSITVPSGTSATDNITSHNKWYFIWDTNNIGYVTMTFYSGATPLATVSNVEEVYYDQSADSITYATNGTVNTISGGNYTSWNWTNNSGVTIQTTFWYQDISNNSSFVDISAGFHLNDNVAGYPAVILPTGTKSFIMTINLDSITDANYSMNIHLDNSLLLYFNGIKLVKTTTGGVVSWQLYRNSTLLTDLYYDSNRNDNTYQLVYSLGDPYDYGSNSRRYDFNYELRYVGGWPKMIGEANAYLTYSYNGGAIINNSNPLTLDGVEFIYFNNMSNNRTPVIRMDGAMIDGVETAVISDQTYSPAIFRNNPATTLENITIYGNAILFGGNTYAVDDSGNITIGTHKISLRGIVFDSVPVSGGYENRINKTVISTTAQPSDITFNGKWSVSVSTVSMESYTYNHTEWTPGHFGWDGLDHNFLIVGLLTSIGVFIALALYVRRSRSSLWPLLIVCGGAVVLFFIML